MAVKSGLLNQKDYISLINNLIKEYYSSPFRTFSNKDLSKNFSLLSPPAQLIQMRSHLTFLNHLSLDAYQNMITTPLDLAVKEVYQKFKNQKASERAVNIIFEEKFGKKQWMDIKQYIIHGKELTLSPQLFSKHALLIEKNMYVPTQGFDMNAYIKLKKIKKIDIKSNAYRAGLRNDDEIAGYYLNFSDTNAPSQISIKRGKETKLVSYYPDEIRRSIPQYELFSKCKNNNTPKAKT